MHLVGGFLAVLILIGSAFTVGAKWSAPETNAASAAASQDSGEQATSTDDSEIPETAEEEFFEVVKVIDGDTITIKINDKNETVRLIGLDTPETHDARTGVQCFGKEATEKLKSVIGDRVAVERDEREGERDKYKRLLAYIYTEEGLFLNKYMIEQGYAYEYTYDDPYKYQKEFKAAEADAKAKKRGLWAPDACPEPKKAAPANVTSAVQPAAATASEPVAPVVEKPEQEAQKVPAPKPEVAPEPDPEPEAEPSSSYTCSSNKYNCSDFKTHAEAQAVFEQCGGADNDVHKLDNNKDGEACESLP